LGRVSAKLFIEFSRKAFQRDDKEFPIFRLRHAAGTEQIAYGQKIETAARTGGYPQVA
jgi:hypothetical protein